MCVKLLRSCPTLCDPWTIAHQAPLSTGFSRQAYWNGQTFPSPRDLPDPGIEPESSVLVGGFFTIESPGKPDIEYYVGMCVSAKSLQSDSLQPYEL